MLLEEFQQDELIDISGISLNLHIQYIPNALENLDDRVFSISTITICEENTLDHV